MRLPCFTITLSLPQTTLLLKLVKQKVNFSLDALRNTLIWLPLGLMVGVPVGLASAVFLYALNYITDFREENLWVIVLLPVIGLLIGWMYHKSNVRANLGSNLIFQEYFAPTSTMPWIKAPLILLSTLLTHLVGASAGREGTAVQMGAVISDSLAFFGKKYQQHRSLFIMAGVGAGFASLFGTPWAGTIFALEILRGKSLNRMAILPAFLSSFSAYYICYLTGAPHTHYEYIEAPEFSIETILNAVFIGALFGLTALLYIKAHYIFSKLAQYLTKGYQAFWRPFLGGIVLFIIFVFLGDSRYMGLGIPTILESFENPVLPYDFIAKLLLTAFALGFGFKGGEVTPLFFVGATLGNALALFVPLPLAFLAATGFISVFSGATKTFLACAVMGIELFGWEAAPYFLLTTLLAQLFSGKSSIYSAQPKNSLSLF